MDLYSSAQRTAKPQVLDVARTQTTGYPISTRTPKTPIASSDGAQVRRTATSASIKSKASQEADTHSKLQGFHVRVINTHSGKAVVRAPILVSEDKSSEEELELPPPSAAELKYTAQRALLSTTAALMASTSGNGRPATRARAARMEPRTPTGQQSRAAAGLGDAGSFKIDLEFDSERPYAGTAGGMAASAQSSRQTVQGRQQGSASVVAGRLEKGRLSTESVLESWGMATAVTGADLSMSNVAATSAVGPVNDTEEESEADSVVEDTALRVEGMARGYPAAIDSVFPGPPGPDNRTSSVVLSDESQRLIESIFSGRLSTSKDQGPPTSTSAFQSAVHVTQFSTPQPRPPPKLSSPEMPVKSEPLKGLGSGQLGISSEQYQTGSRGSSKMRKPSFWSIFRGGSARKEQSADEKDISARHDSDSASHSYLRRRRSSSVVLAASVSLSNIRAAAASKRDKAAARLMPSVEQAETIAQPLEDSTEVAAVASSKRRSSVVASGYHTPDQEFESLTTAAAVAVDNLSEKLSERVMSGQSRAESVATQDDSITEGVGMPEQGGETAEYAVAAGELPADATAVGSDAGSAGGGLGISEAEASPQPGRLQFSPDMPAKQVKIVQTEAERAEEQAVALGRYLYQLEEAHCGAAGQKPLEPALPEALQGVHVPGLVEHAEWLGRRSSFSGRVLQHYMGNYDFAGLRIDECLRRLCKHMYLRGESQVIDRLLEELARRFIVCNPESRLRTVDVAHAVTYSTLLLNTDLHMAQIRTSERMSKSRFVRNTIDTIAQFQGASAMAEEPAVLGESQAELSPAPQLPELDLRRRGSAAAAKASMEETAVKASMEEAATPSTVASQGEGFEEGRRSLVGSMASLNITLTSPSSTQPVPRSSRDVVRLMGSRGKRFSFFDGSTAGGGIAGPAPVASPYGVASPTSLRAFDRLRRKVSTNSPRGSAEESPEPCESEAAVRSGASLADLTGVLKDVYVGIKNRPLGQPAFARRGGDGSQGDLRASMAVGRAKASMDESEFGDVGSPVGGRPSSVRSVPLHAVQRTRSISSLNQSGGRRAVGGEAMRRSGTSMLGFNAVRASPSSASMGVFGGTYASCMRSPIENRFIRSGVLVRKHLFERSGKKASQRSWRTCYVSVDRGTVAMYKMDGRHGGHPDGRELTDTSLQLGSVSLRHTLTQMMPPPGYSRSRPHVFALQLPSGGVYLFQTASEVELRDWVAACNYWAARESKAPYMIGGVYNMEYGWDNTGDFALRLEEREARLERGEEPTVAERAAEERRVAEEREASRNASILEWTPPTNPMQRSELDESSQLGSLLHHIAYLEDELVAHKKVQGSIDERFFARTQQHQRAFSNWERKAQYILKELIKYQSYADYLEKAIRTAQDELAIPEEPSASADSNVTVHEEEERPVGSALGASRASLPQAARRANTEASKALPIKELLAPTSEKARNRASIIGADKLRQSNPSLPSSASPTGTVVPTVPPKTA